MKKNILLSDLLLILKLYAPKNSMLFIFDPFDRLSMDVDYPISIINDNAPKVLINLADEVICYKGMSLNEFELILDFGNSEIPNVFQSKKMNYINNPNKTMRWLYTDNNKNASFLSFYNTATIKSKIIAKTIYLAFQLGVKKLIQSGQFSIHYKAELKINQLINQVTHDDYSIFMGSPGSNRTILVELSTNGKTTHFVKVPANKKSLYAVVNEQKNLKRVAVSNFKSFHIPVVEASTFKDVLITLNVKPLKAKRLNEINEFHSNALQEIAAQTARFYHLKSSTYWEDIIAKLSYLKKGSGYDNIINQLIELKETLSSVNSIYTSLAHGDFTPWNMFVGDNKLYLYDWEQSNPELPMLYDLFHFHFQTGILSKKISLKRIKENIIKACKNENIANIIKTYEIDIDTYFKMYLLKIITDYIIVFQKEKELTLQHQWMLEMYRSSLNEICSYKKNGLLRNEFIKEFNQELQRTAHAFLKFTEGSLEQLKSSSDLDILVLKDDIKNIVKYCKNHPNTERLNIYNKSFMTTIEIFFKDNSFLSIDLINQFKRKKIQMFNAKPLLISAIQNANNIMVPAMKFDFEYCFLFYTLNGASIPQKYQEHYKSYHQLERNKVFNYIDKKYDLKLYNHDELFVFNPYFKLKILSKLEQADFNLKVNRLKNTINYVLDTIKDMIYRRGMVITFSGVDGAGKTTIIEKVRNRLQTKYRKEVVLLRHRPGILPILSAIKHGKKEAEQIASVTLPRKGTNNSLLSSFVRFAYYFADYMIGQVYVYLKYVLRGKIVLYDRYYFDFINDAKRSNIQLNRGFLKGLYLFVFKPKLNFFLYADAATILARKQEMIAPEIDQLTILYKQLFGQMERQYKFSHYTIIENKELDVTLNTIMNSYAKLA